MATPNDANASLRAMAFVANGEMFAVVDAAVAVVDGGLIGKMASKNIGGDAGGKWNDNALDTM